MNLDIEALRLTEREKNDSMKRLVTQDITSLEYQLAKALWGVYDWLEKWDPEPSVLKEILQEDNIKRPEAVQ